MLLTGQVTSVSPSVSAKAEMLSKLVARQDNKCYYCKDKMSSSLSNISDRSTIEHLVDKWSSPKHAKIEAESNLAAACFKCNNTRGNIRNRIARDYYRTQARKYSMNISISSICSQDLYRMFGAVPQSLFNARNH